MIYVLPAGAVIALVALVRLYRARTARRRRVALDAYAEREIARDRRRKAPLLSRLRTWR
jgi:hypothetical protein